MVTEQKKCLFFEIEAYGKVAEYCEKYTTKGRGVRVVGRLKQNRWKDSDGKNVSKVFVVAEHLEYKPIFKKDDSQKDDKVSSSEESSKKEKELTVF